MKKLFMLLAIFFSLSTGANTELRMNCSSFSKEVAKSIFLVEAADNVIREHVSVESTDSFMIPISSPNELIEIREKTIDGLLYLTTVTVDRVPTQTYLVEVLPSEDECMLKEVSTFN